LSVETLTNVGGKSTPKLLPSTGEIPHLIVVTLIIGTADDEALFNEVRTTT
jgi:hypothetical protein